MSLVELYVVEVQIDSLWAVLKLLRMCTAAVNKASVFVDSD